MRYLFKVLVKLWQKILSFVGVLVPVSAGVLTTYVLINQGLIYDSLIYVSRPTSQLPEFSHSK